VDAFHKGLVKKKGEGRASCVKGDAMRHDYDAYYRSASESFHVKPEGSLNSILKGVWNRRRARRLRRR
jgi:hypothetical protein